MNVDLDEWMAAHLATDITPSPPQYLIERTIRVGIQEAWGRSTKYGLDHSTDCLCIKCLSYYWAHKKHQGNRCICKSCVATRKRARVIQETLARKSTQPERETKAVANISICDRPECGSMTKSNVAGAMELFTGGDKAENINAQLCPACAGELVAWYEGPVTGERQKAYSKAWERPTEKSLEKLTSAQLMTLALERGREESNAE